MLFADYAPSASKSYGPTAVIGNADIKPPGRQQNLDKSIAVDNREAVSVTDKTEEKPTSSEMRQKEGCNFIV